MRGRLRRIEQQAERAALVFELEDGSTARFPPSVFVEAFAHEWQRGRELRAGLEPSHDEHPLTTAVKNARDDQVQAAGLGAILMVAEENERAVREGEGG